MPDRLGNGMGSVWRPELEQRLLEMAANRLLAKPEQMAGILGRSS
jgi:hypothetical protein